VMPAPATPIVADKAPTPDPRVGLRAGRWDAAQALWNMRLVSATPPSEKFNGVTNSDLAFTGKYVIQGNYNGFQIFDITDPAKPKAVINYVCPASQSDVSVFRNLLFVSGEGQTGRVDCGIQGVPEPVSKDRLRGIRIFDISDIAHPKYVANVQTCRGSHTHTVVTDPRDKANVYIYVSGSAGVRSADELPGCMDGGPEDPKSARFRIEVIKVPLTAPQNAAIVSSPRIFQGLAPPPRREEPRPTPPPGAAGDPAAAGAAAAAGGAPGAGAAAGAAAAGGAGRGGRGGGPPGPPTGPNQCHDITVYPDIGMAGGACGGYGLLLNIREVAQPFRVDEVADINMAFWHSATFSNDGTKVLFTDEWGGGSQPRCRDTDKPEWGANALFTIENGKMKFQSYYKLPAPQSQSRPRSDGAGVVPGRALGLRLDRCGAPQGNRVLRSRPRRRQPHGDGRVVVGLLVQRPHRQLGDRPRPRHPRVAAQRAADAKRDRRGEDGPVGLSERTGTAQDGVARELRKSARLPRSARTQQRARGSANRRRAREPCKRRETVGPCASAGAEEACDAGLERGGQGRRRGQGEDAVDGGDRTGKPVGLPPPIRELRQ
jgi:hypothetical protein